MKHLFLITINPVQSFIEQARKVHDLAAGSDMLSYFMKSIATYVTNSNLESTQLFPHTDTVAYPHRLLFDCNTNDKDKIKNIAAEIEKHFKNILNQKIDEYLKIINPESFNVAKKQIHQVFNLYWVALEYEENNFTEKYSEIDRLLGSVKNIRPFKQFPEKGRKCSLNGEYNVVAYRYQERENENNSPYWFKFTDNVTCFDFDTKKISNKVLPAGEALSGISFLKRNWKLINGVKSFNATCEIAYLDAVKKLSQKSDTEKAIAELQKIDEQYLYKDAGISDNHKNKKSDIKKLQNKISKTKDGKIKIGKYYAVLMFDADTMGKWLSGEKLKPDADLKDFQDKLSGKLVEFAESAEKYVNGDKGNEVPTKKGQVIYAGGDDFLALIGLEYLFDVVIKLREEFKRIINSDEINELKENIDNEITFSAGIAIAHYKTPLSYVLGEARKAEHTAKDEGDRNAFAITVLKRSGEIVKAYHKWNFEDVDSVKLLQSLIKYRLEDKLSRTFINNFYAEFKPLLENIQVKLTSKPIEMEFKRLMKSSKSDKFDKSEFENFRNEILKLMKTKTEIGRKINIQNFVNLLYISDFISREINKPLN